MKKHILIFAFFIFLLEKNTACTAFMWQNSDKNVMVFKNYDWHQEPAYIITNTASIAKQAFPTGTSPLYWTSKYSSVTVNQYGKEFPIEGMNEVGLVVQTLILPEANYSVDDKKQSINELQFIQYQLDNFRTVDEVVKNLEKISVIPITATVHYFVVDKSGDAAVIDYLEGKLVVSRKNDKNYMTIANSPYPQSSSYWADNQRLVSSRHSLNRFCSVQNILQNTKADETMSIEKGMETLASAAVSSTQWSTAYDVKNKQFYFKTASQKGVKHLDLTKLDFSASFYLPLIYESEKEVSPMFRPLIAEKNLDLLKKTMSHVVVYQINNNLEYLNEYQMLPGIEMETVDYSNVAGTLHLKIEGLKNNQGSLRIAYVDTEENYKSKKFKNAVVILPKNKQGEWTLYNLPYGNYVFGLHHDKNGDDKFNNFLGIPTESFGFSNNAKGFLGFPKYKKAVIRFGKNEQTIVMKCK
jgi:penicillin V acylase-like amidase (Ntn superfamily)/uncharacterized protein (DUF2141 family)